MHHCISIFEPSHIECNFWVFVSDLWKSVLKTNCASVHGKIASVRSNFGENVISPQKCLWFINRLLMTFFPKVINSMYKKSVLQDFILQAKFKLNFLICSFLQNVHSKGCYYYFHSRDIIFVADLIQPRKLSWSCAWSIKPYLSVEWFTFWIGDSLWTTLFTDKYSNKLIDKTAIWNQWANVYGIGTYQFIGIVNNSSACDSQSCPGCDT